MKNIHLHAIFLSVLIVISSCVQDDPIGGNPITQEEKKTNEWIYDQLSDYYLWYDEMPTEAEASFGYEPEAFFYDLLSKKDGKTYTNSEEQEIHYYYSNISQKSGTKAYQGDEPSFGFEYQAWKTQDGKSMALQILYVLPNSPASGKLKRGDWIVKIDNANVGSNYYDLIKNSSKLNFGVADIFSSNATIRESFELTKAAVEDNPVFVSKIITGTNVGYLVYNHFTTGPNGTSDTTFDDAMINAIKNLQAQGVTEFVLDLRYNGGGYVTSAQKLASALSPTDAIDKMFCKLMMNDKHSKEDSSMKLISDYNAGLNLSRLFVITSSRTASASELVIAGLQPYMNLILVGEKTEGKNVGSREYKDDKHDWILQPIVCYVTNSRDDDYSKGLDVQYSYDYSKDGHLSSEEVLDLGEPKEKILEMVLNIIGISTTTNSKTKSITNSENKFMQLNSSLDEKKKNAVILN